MTTPIAMADPAAEYRELKAEIDDAVQRVLASGRFILGPEGEAFEREFAAFIGAAHGVAVNSGTDALHLALVASGIGAGDEVIVPAFTFFASAEAVSQAGATPVFADVDPRTFNLDPDALQARITSRTRAVIAVHLFGQCAPLDEIAAVCERHSLVLVEDCAQAIGADDQGRRAGSVGAFGCFSFYPTKNLAAAGDAGLVSCKDVKHAETLRMLRHHGSQAPYVHERVGWNSRLDELQAALLRVKLRHVERFNAAREKVAQRYRQRLSGLALDLPIEHGRGRHVWHQYTIASAHRDALREALTADRIASAIFYALPLHRQPAYATANAGVSLPVSEQLATRVLSLPSHPFLGDDAVERVATALRRRLERA